MGPRAARLRGAGARTHCSACGLALRTCPPALPAREKLTYGGRGRATARSERAGGRASARAFDNVLLSRRGFRSCRCWWDARWMDANATARSRSQETVPPGQTRRAPVRVCGSTRRAMHCSVRRFCDALMRARSLQLSSAVGTGMCCTEYVTIKLACSVESRPAAKNKSKLCWCR